MLLVAEIAALAMGIVGVSTGKITLSRKRVITGPAARWIGVMLILPLPVALVAGLVVGVLMEAAGAVRNQAAMANDLWLMGFIIELSIFAVCVVIATLIGASAKTE